MGVYRDGCARLSFLTVTLPALPASYDTMHPSDTPHVEVKEGLNQVRVGGTSSRVQRRCLQNLFQDQLKFLIILSGPSIYLEVADQFAYNIQLFT